MKTRIVSSLIMIPFLGVVVLGGQPLFFAAAAIGFMTMHEFYKGFDHMGMHPFKGAGFVCAGLLFAVIYFWVFTDADMAKLSEGLLLWVFVTTVSGLVLCLAVKGHDVFDGLATIIGVIYLAFFSMHIPLIDNLAKNSEMIWLAFITAFGTDTFAYFAGMFMGKHKLCPSISPKKTVEGALGGILGSVLCSLTFCQLVCPENIMGGLAIGFFGSILAQCGDLIASAFKRKMNIKDFGNLIPGHGGVLDRVDSVMLTAPFVYYYIVLFINR